MRPGRAAAVPFAIVAVAVALRMATVGWGLPSLLDPDEPLFVVLGLKLLAGPTLDPGWFGHPGTTTLYVVALIEAALLGIARATGQAADARTWVLGVFQDPTALFVTARIAFALFGAGCVALTWRIARRLWDAPTALAAALLLALNPLHIAWSQVIRTDVQASFFLLLGLAACIDVAERSRRRDYLRAAVWMGAAIATKWPAAAGLVAVVGAGWIAARPPGGRRFAWTAGAVLGAGVALVAISPYLILDTAQVARNLGGEAQPSHLGATGGGPLRNLAWYLAGPIAQSFGWIALAAAAVGAGLALKKRSTAVIVVAPLAAYLIAIALPGLVWERWVVTALPLVAMLAGAGLVGAARRVGGGRVWIAIAVVLAAVPVAWGAANQVRERTNDTRARAERWVAANARPGARVLVEYPALALLRTKLEFRYPAGTIGCIDGRSTLAGTVKLPAVDAVRGGRAILDIGTIVPDRLPACSADLAMFSDYDRYLAEAARYPGELAVYRTMLARGRTVAVFAPARGVSGGPIVRVIALTPNAITTERVVAATVSPN